MPFFVTVEELFTVNLMIIINIYRKIRSKLATLMLKYLSVSCGQCVGAARIPHISRMSRVEIGSHCGFNRITITGKGGKAWQLFPFRDKCQDNAWQSRLFSRK